MSEPHIRSASFLGKNGSLVPVKLMSHNLFRMRTGEGDKQSFKVMLIDNRQK